MRLREEQATQDLNGLRGQSLFGRHEDRIVEPIAPDHDPPTVQRRLDGFIGDVLPPTLPCLLEFLQTIEMMIETRGEVISGGVNRLSVWTDPKTMGVKHRPIYPRRFSKLVSKNYGLIGHE